MEILSEEFVSGIDIDDALNKFDQPKVPCSFDMLGEAARTQSDVDFFFDAYEEACLLYTSPSPRDGLLSRMPSSA